MNPWEGIKINLTLAENYFLSGQDSNLQISWKCCKTPVQHFPRFNRGQRLRVNYYKGKVNNLHHQCILHLKRSFKCYQLTIKNPRLIRWFRKLQFTSFRMCKRLLKENPDFRGLPSNLQIGISSGEVEKSAFKTNPTGRSDTDNEELPLPLK